jgi:hypothetical protein
MKRKKVMRLLAFTMAATVAVTAQGIPAGLTTVYAEENNTAAVTEVDIPSATDGTIYKEVYATEHTHVDGCFTKTGSNTIVQADESTNKVYYTGKDSEGNTTYTAFAAGTWVEKDASATAWDLKGNNQFIGPETSYDIYQKASAAEITKIENAVKSAKAADQSEDNVAIVYLTQADVNAIAASYATEVKTVSTTDGYTALIGSDGTAATVTSGYYTVEFVKVFSAGGDASAEDAALAIKGAVKIDTSNQQFSALGYSAKNLTVGDVYIPATIKAYTYTAAAGNTATTGSGDSAVDWKYDSTNGWYNTAPVTASVTSLGFALNTSNDGYEIQLGTAATVNDTKEHNTYNTAADGTGTEVASTAVVKYKAAGDSDYKYYTDVTDNYVTALKVTSATATISDSAAETDIADGVTLTTGLTTTDTTLAAAEVINDYEGTGDTAYVKGFNLDATHKDLVYFDDTDGDNIVDEGEEVKLSTLDSKQAIIDAGLADEDDLKIALTKIAAPTVSTEISGGTKLDGTGLDANVYDGDETAPTITATITEKSSSDETASWTYKWVDELVDDNGTVLSTVTTNAAAALNTFTATYSPAEPGHHNIYVLATETSSSATKAYDATELYVMTENPATISISNSSVTYGSAITPTVIKDATQSVAPQVNYSYVETGVDAGTERSGNGLPVEPGTYTITATIPADYANGYKETVATFKNITINKDDTGTAKAATVAALDESDSTTATWSVDLSDVLAQYNDTANNIILDKTADKATETTNSDIDLDSVAYEKSTGILTFKLATGAQKQTTTLNVKFENSRYEVAVTISVDIKDAGTTVETLDLTPVTIYYNDYTTSSTAADVLDMLMGSYSGALSSDYFDFAYDKSNTSTEIFSDATTVADVPSAVGTYTLYVSYDSTGATDNTAPAVGSGTTTLTIAKKPIDVTIEDKTLTIGKDSSIGSFVYTAETAADAKAISATEVGSHLTWVVKDSDNQVVELKDIDLTTPGTYSVTATSNYDTNYIFTANTATLTIEREVSADPVIEGPDEEFDESAEVTITAAAGATIYYTTEDIELTAENGTEYTGAITLEDTATVKAIAVEDGKDASAVVSKTFTKKAVEDNGDPDDGNTDDNNAPDDGNTDDGNTDDNNANDNTAGDNNTDDNTAGDNNANDNTGDTTTTPSTGDTTTTPSTGTDSSTGAGTGNTGSDANGSGNSGSDANGSGNAGSDANGSGNAGSDANGSGNSGSDANGSGNAGSDNSGSGNTGSDASVSTGSGSTAATGTAATTTTATGETHIEAAADGTRTIVDASGAVVTSAKVTIGGNDYITDAAGTVVTNALTTTPSGNTVYAGKDGAIVKNKTVTVSGKKYYATKTGKIAKSGFYTTAKGNTVYATKSGQLKASKAFTVGGKKYVAKKSGAIYKNTTVTIGNKKYTINKKGVVTKTVTVK